MSQLGSQGILSVWQRSTLTLKGERAGVLAEDANDTIRELPAEGMMGRRSQFVDL